MHRHFNITLWNLWLFDSRADNSNQIIIINTVSSYKNYQRESFVKKPQAVLNEVCSQSAVLFSKIYFFFINSSNTAPNLHLVCSVASHISTKQQCLHNLDLKNKILLLTMLLFRNRIFHYKYRKWYFSDAWRKLTCEVKQNTGTLVSRVRQSRKVKHRKGTFGTSYERFLSSYCKMTHRANDLFWIFIKFVQN